MKCHALWGIGLLLGLLRAGYGQAVPPPNPGERPDVNNLAHQMAERVRHLGEDIESDLGQTPAARHMVQDATELAQAISEFHDSLHDRPDLARSRQAYSGIDVTWHHLRGHLSGPGASSPAIDRAARRVDEIDARLHQAFGMNPYPAGFAGEGPAPAGIADTRRLAHAMVSRAEALADAIQADMGRDPNGAALARDAGQLARAADTFHDTIDANQPVSVAAQAFGPVDRIADRIERYVTTNRVPPRVQQAWQAFAAVEVLIHQNLGLASPQPAVQLGLAPPAEGGRSPLSALADQLVQQTGAFAQAFGPASGDIQDGETLLADAERLRAAAADFREDAGRGLAPNQLAYEFRDVDATSQRLARRVGRLGRGRPRPGIQQYQRIGETCEQIHRVLGMPGSPPMLGGPTFDQAPPRNAGDVPPPVGRPAIPRGVPRGGGANPDEIAKATSAFVEATKRLQQAVREVAEDSPLVADLGRLSRSAGDLRQAVEKGEGSEHAVEDFRAIEGEYGRFEVALKKDHDAHHDDRVVAEAKKVNEAFGHLRDHMAGRRD